MSARWKQVKEILQSALELPPEKREKFVDKACADDLSLQREVKTLLVSSENIGSFMERAAINEVADVIKGSSEKLAAGKQFAHYEIVRQIGTGGMGEVYLAKDKKLDRRVAVKILNEKFAAHESNLNRFIREAKAASALNHPNILVIHEIGEIENSNYIVSEFIEGETLREFIKQSSLKLSEILDIVIQIANALVAAHTAHIVHRDIKPENIIVRPDGLVKILDFGLAKLVKQNVAGLDDLTLQQNQTGKGIILGTVEYMSPEQAKGEKIDERTDIFSFGVVLYEMIAGRTPFAGESTSDTLANLITVEPPLSRFSAKVPDELTRIVAKTLRKNKHERYQSAQYLLMDLKNFQKRLEFETAVKYSQIPKINNTEILARTIRIPVDPENQILPLNNLSESLSSFVGRGKEIAEIEDLLRRKEVQLITMIGVGGAGKTRLAQAVAERSLQNFSGGVFFVELAANGDSACVASAIAQTLGVKEAEGKPILEVLKDYLREKQMLIVIDSFEQVTEAAPKIDELISAAANLKILITSRTSLHLRAEREFVVPPLALPGETSEISLDELANYEAVQLFVERARKAKPNFVLHEENARSVTEICRRLDGLPLAIELAAARVKIFSPQSILRKLERRLKPLTGGARDSAARQQTMRGTIEWSSEILSEDTRKLFRRLAVFAGEFTLEAAESVSAPNAVMHSSDQLILDLITSLVDKSLLVAREQPDGKTRFRMPAVIREYALESLEASGEAETIPRRQSDYYLAFGEKAVAHSLKGTGGEANTLLISPAVTKSGNFVASIADGSVSTIEKQTPEVNAVNSKLSYIIALLVCFSAAGGFGFWFYGNRQQTNQIEPIAVELPKPAPKLYRQMTEVEQLAFIRERAPHIQNLIDDEPTEFDDEALRSIKVEMDDYVERQNSLSQKPFEEGLRVIYGRASQYAPIIIRAYEARQIPPASGIYQAMIESEYHDCQVTRIGSAGLFQFVPKTAAKYNLTPKDYCNVEKQSDAAARYMSDLSSDFVSGKSGATLGLLGFVIGENRVRDYLRQLRERGVAERSFWSVLRHRQILQPPLSDDGKEYVPRFFAAAIIGETPEVFELSTPPLTTLGEKSK